MNPYYYYHCIGSLVYRAHACAKMMFLSHRAIHPFSRLTAKGVVLQCRDHCINIFPFKFLLYHSFDIFLLSLSGSPIHDAAKGQPLPDRQRPIWRPPGRHVVSVVTSREIWLRHPAGKRWEDGRTRGKWNWVHWHLRGSHAKGMLLKWKESCLWRSRNIEKSYYMGQSGGTILELLVSC